jgi:hypothetical protein
MHEQSFNFQPSYRFGSDYRGRTVLKAAFNVGFKGEAPLAMTACLASFGMPFRNRFINPGDEICDIVNADQSGTILLRDLNGVDHEYVGEPFNSGYRVFVLISQPTGAHRRISAHFRT